MLNEAAVDNEEDEEDVEDCYGPDFAIFKRAIEEEVGCNRQEESNNYCSYLLLITTCLNPLKLGRPWLIVLYGCGLLLSFFLSLYVNALSLSLPPF